VQSQAAKRPNWLNLLGLFGNLTTTALQARRHAIRTAAEDLVGIGGA
jgi:hypothetical protein